MDIDFKRLEAFVYVAESGTFTRSAEHLNLSQTAITHRIAKLEQSLGTQLLLRSARGVTLTPAGSELLPKIKTMLGDLNRELANTRAKAAEPVARLSIACLPTIAGSLLGPVLGKFATRHPTARVSVLDVSANEILPLVTSGTVELGLTITAATDEELSVEPLMSEDYFLICPSRHPFARKRTVTWAEIGDEKLIRVSSQTANRFIIDQALGSRSETQQWAYEVQHTLTAVRLVQAGIGLTVAPKSALQGIEADDIAAKPLREPRVTRTIGLVTRRGAGASLLAQSFRTILKSTVGTLAA